MSNPIDGQTPEVPGWVIVVACLLVIVVILVVVSACVSGGWEGGRDQLARQIAEGTHKVEHTTNAFGTLEWRVVEVEEGMEE